MAAQPSEYKDRHFLAVIGDEVGGHLMSATSALILGLGFSDRSTTCWDWGMSATC